MSQQTYPVACACGKVHQCPAGYAGSKFACPCGKAVEVPTLSRLRAQVPQRGIIPGGATSAHVPQAEVNPVSAILALARAGQLPIECECVRCGQPTTDVVTLLVECEKPKEQSAVPVVVTILLFVFLRGIGLLLSRLIESRMGGTQVVGEYVAFDLPVRVCAACKEQLADHDRAHQALLAAPLYARLLKQYPNAAIIESSLAPGRRILNPNRRRKNRRLLMWLVGVWAGLAFYVSTLFFGDHILSGFKASGEMTRDHRHLAFAAIAVAALGVAVVVGWGVAKLVGNVYRHFYPDITKPTAATSVNSNSEDRP